MKLRFQVVLAVCGCCLGCGSCVSGAIGGDNLLQSREYVEEGRFYSSHPTEIKVVRSDFRSGSNLPVVLLRVTMETTQTDGINNRKRNLFFAQQQVGAYMEAIERYLKMAEGVSNSSKTELARIPSWQTFERQMDLVFDYIPAVETGSSERTQPPFLCISLAYDMEHRGGSFYFDPVDARLLLTQLIGFIGEI